MGITVGDVYDLVNKMAPFELAGSWDKVGLHIGSKDIEVTSIILAVDLNMDVIDMAVKEGANLIITHHPVIFEPLQTITYDTATGKLVMEAIKNSINIISAHTNLDAAKNGVTETLAKIVGIKNLKEVEDCSVMRVGELKKPLSVEEFVDVLKKSLKIQSVSVTKNMPDTIKTVAVVAGRGCALLMEAKKTNADVFLLGEIKHENAVYANVIDLCVISCGHHETEVIVLKELKTYLQKRCNELQLKVGVYECSPMIKY